jgi:hypothetical protein
MASQHGAVAKGLAFSSSAGSQSACATEAGAPHIYASVRELFERFAEPPRKD